MKRAFLYLFVTVLLLTLSSQALALEVNRKVTPEGLTVLHVERNHLPMVVFVLLVNAGAVHEPAELAGLASLTTSLLEEGTERRTSTEISEEIEFIGARYSSSAGMDYTTLSFTVLKKDLKKGFDVFADVLLNPAFPEDEVARVKELVKGSLKQREENPSFLAGRAFRKEIYGDHPYGRIVAGMPETVEAVGRDDIEKFHSIYYTPNNSILAVVGDISPPELDRLLGRFFGKWKRKPLPPFGISPPEKSSGKVVKIDKDLTQANIVLGHLGVRRDNPDYEARQPRLLRAQGDELHTRRRRVFLEAHDLGKGRDGPGLRRP
jgi:zinc protease